MPVKDVLNRRDEPPPPPPAGAVGAGMEEVLVGMRLEAVDKEHPSLTAPAEVIAVDTG